MLTQRLLWAAATFLVSTPALAAADLAVSIPATPAAHVYDSATYTVNIDNIGNRRAKNVQVLIDLPATNTSPAVHVMGELDAVDSRCVLANTQLRCNLGHLRKNRSTSISFDLELPEATTPLSFTATASSTNNDSNPANDSATYTPTLLNYSTTVADGDLADVRHCTGSSLTSFFECTVSPSSIATHSVEFHGDGTLSFPDQPAYDGTWSQTSSDSLSMTYTYNGIVRAEFEGYGTSPGCFEGITTFPQTSTWVSAYEVCI
jgi:uncharacterized repeat protein (TIGR01451 family)